MESAREPAPDIDIDQLAAEMSQLALSHQLIVVPATPVCGTGCGYLILLDHNHLSAAEFCALAANAGAKLLYVQAEHFAMRTDLDMILGSDQSWQGISVSDELADFRSYVESFNGRTRQLELAFVIGCVLHCWAVAANWYLDLLDRAAELYLHPESS
jgi:hypothetical protein